MSVMSGKHGLVLSVNFADERSYNGGSTIYDTSGFKNHLTVTGTAIPGYAAGIECFQIAEGGYLLNSNPSVGTIRNALSVVSWIYPGAITETTYAGILSCGPRSCGGETGTGFLLSLQSSRRPSIARWCSDYTPGSGTVVPASPWSFYSATLNNGTLKIYINSVKEYTTTVSSNNLTPGALAVGTTDLPGRHFIGYIGEVHLLNREVDEREMLEIFEKSRKRYGV